jgi:hypothetical protein
MRLPRQVARFAPALKVENVENNHQNFDKHTNSYNLIIQLTTFNLFGTKNRSGGKIFFYLCADLLTKYENEMR